MIVERALKEYLTNLTANTVRMEPRQKLLNKVQRNVTIGNVPARTDTEYALTIRRSYGGTRYDDLPGEAGCAKPAIEIELWSKKAENAAEVVQAAVEYLRLAINSYRGMWGDLYVHGVTLTDGMPIPTAPRDNSDDWKYRLTIIARITHNQERPE